MQEYLTLEEAADKLGMSPNELKGRLRDEWKHVRTFRDGASLRISVKDIEELRRRLGFGSDPEVQLSEPTSADNGDAGVDEPLLLNFDDDAPAKGPTAPPAGDDDPLVFAEEAADDDDAVPIGLAEDASKDSDSDVRLEKADPPAPPEESTTVRTEEVKLDQDLTSGSSEFEINLDDSDSDFELTLAEDGSDEEVPLGGTSKKPGDSGINLGAPKDSGVSLESSAEDSGKQDLEFELEVDGSSTRMASSKPGKAPTEDDEDDSSEFELTLDNSSDLPDVESTTAFEAEEAKNTNDIFQTDFDIPALDVDSESEAVELDSDTDIEMTSDFDLELEEAEVIDDEVVELDDDEEAPPRRRRRAVLEEDVELDDDLDDEMSASRALRGVSLDEDEDYEDEYADLATRRVAAPAPWGWGTMTGLVLCFLFIVVCGFVGYDLLHSMWGYRQGVDAPALVVTQLADAFGLEPATR